MAKSILIRLFATIVAFALIYLLQYVINSHRRNRGRQALLPVLALIYAVIATVVASVNFEKVAALCATNEFLKNANVALLNIFVISGFLTVKCVACPIVNAVWKSDRLMEATSVRFYEYDADYDTWFLQKRWVNFRKLMKALSLFGGVLCAALLSFTWITGPGNAWWLYYFPSAALTVLWEAAHFLNGITKAEFEHAVFGDYADSRRISHYYLIRELYERLFEPQMLSSHTGCEFTSHRGATVLLSGMENSPDITDKAAAKYFELHDKAAAVLDPDFVQAANNLLHRKNVVFFNPFYRDLGQYIVLPMVNALLSGKKCLIIAGRNSTCEDVKPWLTDLIKNYCHMRELWRVNDLSEHEPDCEIGVLSFQHLYDLKVMKANYTFFANTDFVFLIEPSLVINTGQVGMSIVASEIAATSGGKPVYCICDRNTDGLVDTLSHLLRSEFTDVVAMPVPRCVYTGMAWNADGDFIRQQLFNKQTRYLGNGIELAAVAVKNQIPKVVWYSETKVPIRDIKWITGQYHPTICRYMNLPSQQNSLYEKIDFVSNLWCGAMSPEQFIIVEDEFCNMFSTMRAYLSRGCDQTFVNVMSENYLLRDYMRCNGQMFTSDPNAIPSVVPDYAKTERNTVLKLILLMSFRPVAEEEALNELNLAGCETNDAFGTLSRLIGKYTFADDSILTIRQVPETADENMVCSPSFFTVTEAAFDTFFSDTLRNAYYVVEEEEHDNEHIDAKLFGHIAQTILPGQFVTYDGKYYEAKIVSPLNGVVLRRASDLYDGRKYYRQVRKYSFEPRVHNEIVSNYKIMDIEVSFLLRQFNVETTGYLEMNDSHDLRMARVIDFALDPSVGNYTRHYRNKAVLRIKLPDTNDRIRFTISMLLSEVFRSVFPDAWQYLAVVAKRPDDIDGMLNYLMYKVEGDIEDDYIYIIEDSDIDLGLLGAVERKLTPLMEIVADFLEWHFEKIREAPHKDPVPASVKMPADEKRRSAFVRMADRIRKIFGVKKEQDLRLTDGKPEKSEKPAGSTAPAKPAEEKPQHEYAFDAEQSAAEESVTPASPQGEGATGDYALGVENMDETVSIPAQAKPKSVPQKVNKAETQAKHIEDQIEPGEEDPDLVHIDGTDIFDTEGTPEDDVLLEESLMQAGVIPIEKSRYQMECYLKFGFDEIDARIQIEETRRYLRVRGWCNNSLTKARKREGLKHAELDLDVVNHCDFCGLPLSGVSYEKLNDGRTRCNDCSNDAITSVEEFRELFLRVLETMKGFFSIDFRVPISVKTADARKIAAGVGCVFMPSTGFAERVMGYARKRSGHYDLFMENGCPHLAAVDTMVHELTHIWQFINWNDAEIQKKYGNERNRELVYEGMATWAAVQYLYQIGEPFYAEQQEMLLELRDDIYGEGFKLYREKYPFVKDFSLLKFSPFSVFPPL